MVESMKNNHDLGSELCSQLFRFHTTFSGENHYNMETIWPIQNRFPPFQNIIGERYEI